MDFSVASDGLEWSTFRDHDFYGLGTVEMTMEKRIFSCQPNNIYSFFLFLPFYPRPIYKILTIFEG